MKIHLIFAAMAVGLLALILPQARNQAITYDQLVAYADKLSHQPYEARKPVASQQLRQLNYDQYRDIRWKDMYNLWRQEGLPFQIKFFITGHVHSLPVDIFEVKPRGINPMRYSPNFFDYGKNSIPSVDKDKGGFSGFRVHYPINKPDYLDEVLVMLDGCYFRAVAKNLIYGISARGIAINPATDKRPEEFPAFTDFWLVRPQTLSSQLIIYALLDGPSICGVYEFNITPGVETRIEVRMSLFLRKKIETLALAPMTSMFWYGENTSNTFGSYRPEVHDSDGLLICNSHDEWVWRPLSWSKQTQINIFQGTDLKGFGLLQRDRDFSHYQDLESNYHQRPSLWIEPRSNWGSGSIKLIQFPTANEFQDNILAFWQPNQMLAPGKRFDFAYTQIWYGENSQRPALARCIATRVDYQDQPYYRLYVLDFQGNQLANLPPTSPPQVDLWISEGGAISNTTTVKNLHDNTWRVSFVASTKLMQKPLELRCALRQNNKTLSETWSYTWIPQSQ